MKIDKKTTVIGLGSMGLKLADLLVNAGYSVSVWNRTIEKAKSLSGTIIQEDIAKAIEFAPTIVICVYDYKAIRQIFDQLENKKLLSGKTIINFTTGSPQEVEELDTWLNGYDAGYINGALQVAPDQMGLADTTILLSGNKDLYSRTEPILKVFGGNLKYLGSKTLLASAMDLATLSWLYGSYIGLIYGVGLCQQSGLSLGLYKDILAEITPGFTEFFKHQIDAIDKKEFEISQSPLAISVTATQRIHQAVKDYSLNDEFFSVISSFLKRADDKGLGGKELASLITIINEQSTIQKN